MLTIEHLNEEYFRDLYHEVTYCQAKDVTLRAAGVYALFEKVLMLQPKDTKTLLHNPQLIFESDSQFKLPILLVDGEQKYIDYVTVFKAANAVLNKKSITSRLFLLVFFGQIFFMFQVESSLEKNVQLAKAYLQSPKLIQLPQDSKKRLLCFV